MMSPAINTTGGWVILGLQKKEANCIFLEGISCQIHEFRPLTCRAFPYTFKIRDQDIYWGYSPKAKEYCPGIKKKPPPNKPEIETIAQLILDEMDEFRQLIQVWNHLAQQKIITPTPELLLDFITGKISLTIESTE